MVFFVCSLLWLANFTHLSLTRYEIEFAKQIEAVLKQVTESTLFIESYETLDINDEIVFDDDYFAVDEDNDEAFEDDVLCPNENLLLDIEYNNYCIRSLESAKKSLFRLTNLR